MDGQIETKSSSVDDKSLSRVDSLLHPAPNMVHDRDDRLRWESINMGEEYIRGRLDMLIGIEALPGWNEKRENTIGGHGNLNRHELFARSENQIDKDHPDNFTELNYGSNADVFVFVIEEVKAVESFPVTRGVYRKVDEKLLGVLSGCFHTSGKGFKILPALPGRQFSPVVLCSAIHPYDFPDHVVQSAPEIVNDVAQNKRNLGWGREITFNIDLYAPITPVILVTFNNREVGARVHERSKHLIKISEVMLGPF